MTTRAAISVSECDPKRPLLVKPNYQSSSVEPSMRSSRSRVTLVGYDAEFDPKIDVSYGTADTIKDFSWLDHLLAVFCISRRSKFKTVQTNVSERAPDLKDREVHVNLPWVQPVYVLSTARDEYRHFIPKEAKCTIDTGNLQGNIVSRTFLVDALGHSEANFQKLTKEEEDGGTGITGHRLIPEGAINLTWYHSNSTRVFRDMRFLISEHPMYDLIIGAHSIRKYNILDVPNLVGGDGRIDLTKGPRTPALDKLEEEKIKANDAWSAAVDTQYDEDDYSSDTQTQVDSLKEKSDTKREEWEIELKRVYELEIQKPTSPWDVKKLQDLFKQKTLGKDINDVQLPPDPHHEQ